MMGFVARIVVEVIVGADDIVPERSYSYKGFVDGSRNTSYKYSGFRFR